MIQKRLLGHAANRNIKKRFSTLTNAVDIFMKPLWSMKKRNLRGEGGLNTSLLMNNNSNIKINKQTQYFNSSLVEKNNMLPPPTNNIFVLNDNDFNTLETVEFLLQSKSYIANDVSLPYINICK